MYVLHFPEHDVKENRKKYHYFIFIRTGRLTLKLLTITKVDVRPICRSPTGEFRISMIHVVKERGISGREVAILFCHRGAESQTGQLKSQDAESLFQISYLV